MVFFPFNKCKEYFHFHKRNHDDMCLLKTCHIKHDVFWLSAFRYDNVFIGLNLEFMTSPFNIVQANLTVHRLVRFYTFFFYLKHCAGSQPMVNQCYYIWAINDRKLTYVFSKWISCKSLVIFKLTNGKCHICRNVNTNRTNER